MSLEPGGRADKYGNQYENRHLARLLLWLVQEQLVSVEVEPLGPAGEGVEYITIDPGGSVFYYQCKLSNGTSDSWTLSDLNRYDVFQRSKTHILRSPQSNYCFISPLLYHGLDELCKRARTNSSPQDFQRYQLNNPQIKKLFKDYAHYQGLDPAKPHDLSALLDLLKHSYFEQYSSGTEAVRDLETFCGMTFVGNTAVIRGLLENYANDTGKFGVRISSLDVATYMEQKGCPLRNYEKDTRVTPKIQMLNKQFSDGYQLINNRLLPRSATEALFQHMISGHSVLLHGRAGSGKSGTIQGLIQWLSDANVPYLAIKLDKQTPTGCADAFGVKLGLPESPVFCLKKISAGKPSVLILDQLDALRWAGKHSQNALDVCKEMILQAQTVNKEGPGLLSIVLVSRTFDYENDPGIRNLLRTGDKKTAKWEEVRVEYLTDAEVRQVVGASYGRMPKRLKAILQIPSSLFVWTNLQEQNRSDSIATISELMDTWWRQILQSCLTAGLDRSDVVSCKDLLVARMEQSTSFALPMRLFQDYSQIIDALASNGLLVKTEKLVSFTHQSFLDYFLTNRAIAKIYEGAQITEFIEDTQNQTPNLRYRLLATLQSLCDADEALFLKQCEYILGSDQVRFYYQCAVFEVLGQCDNPSATAIEIAEQYWRNPSWHSIVFQTVYLGHVPFVERLGQSFPFDWLSEESLTLLTSINIKAPDFVINTLRPFCFQDEDTDRKIFSALCCDACDDSEAMFSLRLELLKQRPSLFSGFWGLSLLFKSQSERAIPLIKAAVQGSAVDSLSNIYFPGEETQRKYAKIHFIQIVAELYPVICEKTANSAPTWPQYRVEKAYQKWCAYEYQESTARKIALFVKFAFTEYAQINPLEMFQVLASYHDTHSAIGHEIALSAVENLPLEQADQAVSWLLSDFSYNLFDYTSDTSDYLASAKRIIMKFSPICRLSLFLQLEKNVCSWKDDVRQMISSYRYRLEYNQDPNRTSPPAYWAYWGHFQKELLPCMEQGRLSAYAKALLGTLKRNKWITAPHYYIGFCIGEMKPVVSPRPSQNLCKPPIWCRIGAPHWRFL